MRLRIEVINGKLILPLPVLRTEIGLAFYYFGLLLGIKASDILHNSWLLGLWGILLLSTLLVDLTRPKITSSIPTSTDKSRSAFKIKYGRWLRTSLITIATVFLTFILIENNELIFSRTEIFFRVIHYGHDLENWILLSLILVVTNLFGALASHRKKDTAPYARLFPIFALGIIYMKGAI